MKLNTLIEVSFYYTFLLPGLPQEVCQMGLIMAVHTAWPATGSFSTKIKFCTEKWVSGSNQWEYIVTCVCSTCLRAEMRVAQRLWWTSGSYTIMQVMQAADALELVRETGYMHSSQVCFSTLCTVECNSGVDLNSNSLLVWAVFHQRRSASC